MRPSHIAHGANVPARCIERPEQSVMAVTGATIQRQSLKVPCRNIAPEFSSVSRNVRPQ
jgi:hypothetical protein